MSAKSPGPEAGLAGRIAAEIERGGPMRFSQFMELALYDPAEGYYASGRARVGKAGDFVTNVSIGRVYGEILATQFAALRRLMGEPDDFWVIEQGAHDGQLARDVLEASNGSLRYGIVEPSGVWRARQAETLAGQRVSWFSSLDELPRFCGVHFSNELFDALPFDVVQSTGTAWRQRLVTVTGGRFGWVDGPQHAVELPSRPLGYTTEVGRDHSTIFRPLADRLERGFVLAMDYGYPEPLYYAPFRSEGTLACYRSHRRDADPLEAPGEKDISAHVNFSALAREAAGFSMAGFADQHHFLVDAGTPILQRLDGATTPEAAKTLRAFRMLFHPETMGRQFHAIAFSRNVDVSGPLPGFRHSRALE